MGGELCRVLLDRGHEVRALDIRRPSPRSRDIAEHIDWRVGDASRTQVMAQALAGPQIDAVYYGAFYRAFAHGATLEQEVEVMGTGVFRTMEIAHALGVRRIIIPSSIAVHGPQLATDPEYDEKSAVRPYEVYGVLKLLCEYACTLINSRIGMKFATAIRVPSVYGPGAVIGSRSINVAAVEAARGRTAHVPYAPTARVCVGHVTDTAVGLASAMESEATHDVYGLGGINASYEDMANAVKATLPDADIRFGDDEASPFPHRINYELGRRDFGFAHRDLVTGMKSVIDYERSNLASTEVSPP